MESVSLFELNEYIKQVLALNFPEPVWVRAEIAQVNESRGHYYLELVEKDQEGIALVAKAQAVVWRNAFQQLRVRYRHDLDQLLKEGIEVLVKAGVSFHEQYGLKMVITDIDPEFTLGRLAARREEILRRLQEEELVDRNRQLQLPVVLQRIAVLSSPGSAGYQDFCEQLEHNPYGYGFHQELFPVAVQGARVEPELIDALSKVLARAAEFDLIVILRGGGSRLDLMGFDSYDIGRSIAFSALAVVTGIGHERDETVADRVAHQSLKTPTAVAEFLIHHNLRFEARMEELSRGIQVSAGRTVRRAGHDLLGLSKQLRFSAESLLKDQSVRLDFSRKALIQLFRQRIRSAKTELTHTEEILEALGPQAILARGYSITSRADGTVIRLRGDVSEGETIQTVLQEGKIISIVKNTQKHESGETNL